MASAFTEGHLVSLTKLTETESWHSTLVAAGPNAAGASASVEAAARPGARPGPGEEPSGPRGPGADSAMHSTACPLRAQAPGVGSASPIAVAVFNG